MSSRQWLQAAALLFTIGCAGEADTTNTLPDGVAESGRASATRPPADTARPGTDSIKLFYISIEGATKDEKIGCNDGLVAVNVDAANTQAPLRFALERLLDNETPSPDGTAPYNALAPMDLRVDSIGVTGDSATIRLSGKFAYGGVCDAPRIEAQLMKTATQFPTIRVASFYINGRPLREMLSEK